MMEQFSRTQMLLGEDAMEKLQKARVIVFGVGGVGGYTVEAGTLVLQGIPTPHSYYNVPDDWDYASMQGSDVTVKSGAAFQQLRTSDYRLERRFKLMGNVCNKAASGVFNLRKGCCHGVEFGNQGR